MYDTYKKKLAILMIDLAHAFSFAAFESNGMKIAKALKTH